MLGEPFGHECRDRQVETMIFFGIVVDSDTGHAQWIRLQVNSAKGTTKTIIRPLRTDMKPTPALHMKK
jgi:hypothetical protein